VEVTTAAFLTLLAAICTVESNNRNLINIDDGGSASYGQCQVKLRTARHVGYHGSVVQLWKNPVVNRMVAGRYLAEQLRRYRGDVRKAVSAYNAGRAVGSNGKYVDKVLSIWRGND